MEDDQTLARAKAHAISQPRWGASVQSTKIDRRQCQRTRPMEVLCLGRERTGTLSLRAALLLLGYYDVYHMSSALLENPADCDMWVDALDAKFGLGGAKTNDKKPFGRAEWDALLGHCAAVTDQPCAAFGEDLIKAYPEAKVILTVRDTPEAWHRSFCNTIGQMMALCSPPYIRHPGWNPMYQFLSLLAPKMSGHPSSQAFFDKTADALEGDKLLDGGEARKRYLAHNQHIRDVAREQGSQFLEFNVKQGWEPLCSFLGKPLPEGVSFPNVNDTAEHQQMVKDLRWLVPLGYAMNAVKIFGVPAAAAGAWWWMKRR